MSKKWWFFIFSGLIIIPGIISLILWGVRLSIDFTGGTLLELSFNKKVEVTRQKIQEVAKSDQIELVTVTKTGDNAWLLRAKPMDKDQNQKLQQDLSSKISPVTEIRFETVGPTIGAETTRNAVIAVFVASLAIIIYIALAFRHIPKPYSPWKFGISAVFALVHDVLVVVGIFSLLGHFYNVEIDSLFITALLTVMGFSVHDSIVVFDRIRENLVKMPDTSFTEVVNDSLVETLARSLSTSLMVLFTLFALLLFSGETIRWFIVALLVGIASGTYSSIFNASPLLVIWEERNITPRR